MTLRVSFHTYPKGWPFPLSWTRLPKFRHQYDYGKALREGMERHGVITMRGRRNHATKSDIAVIWSWKQHRLIQQMLESGRHIIVLERGFLPPRKQWCSMALDGFNGRGIFPPAGDSGERWEKHFSHLLKPWRETDGEFALIIGKGAGDPSLHGSNFMRWATQQAKSLREQGYRVVYRPHPDRPTPCPPDAELSRSSLQEDLARASVVVSFNSTTDVEAILAGIPAIITDEGSLAYAMASHSISEPIIRPDRTQWCNDMAWRQWTIEELRNGDAWDHFRQVLG